MGVPSFEWTHFATRLSRLINMLNSDGQLYCEQARASLFRDQRRRKVPLVRGSDPSFQGYGRKPNGKLDSRLSWIRGVV